MSDFIKNFSELGQNDVAVVGGKGANLAALHAAGFSVPPGFCITTGAYREFSQHSGLEEKIISKIEDVDLAVLENIQTCGAAMRQLIMEREIPDEMKEAIVSAYRGFKHPVTRCARQPGFNAQFVAVRSSATAEDLPDMSFAGQHDSYLNISGESDLLLSVKKCWASLWSDRAIAYRHKNNIDHTQVLMAVVVQQMAPSSVSGILFTANPLTHDRHELVINANWGLGESVVSGKSSPDEYTVAKKGLGITSQNIAEKNMMMITLGEGGSVAVPVPSEQRTQPCLSEGQLQELASIGKEIEEHYQAPQDIEWGFAENHLYILQSRPITTLQARPETIPVMWGHAFTREALKDTVIFWSNWNVRETMPYPQSPLNWSLLIDVILPAFLHSFSGLTKDSPLYPYSCALDLVYGRIYWNMNILYGSPLSRLIFRAFLPHIDQEAGTLFNRLYRDGTLQPPKYSTGLGVLIMALLKNLWIFLRLPWLISAEKLDRTYQHYWQKALEFEGIELEGKSNQELMESVAEFGAYSARLWLPLVMIAVLNVVVSVKAFQWLSAKWDDVAPDKFLAGIPGNKTTEGALELYKLSQMPESLKQLFLHRKIEEIPSFLEESEEGRNFLKRLERFLESYGHRGAKEMEIRQPRWRDDPSFVFQMIKNYLQLDDRDMTPLEHFNKQAEERERLITLVDQRLSQGLFSRRLPWKTWLFHKMLNKASIFMPLRENEKYYGGKWYSGSRRIFAEIGRRLCSKGYLETVEDVYFLTLPELESLFQEKDAERKVIKTLVQQRKEKWKVDSEVDPPCFVRSDGKPIFSAGYEPEDPNVLTGAPASGGRVTGKARIIFDPVDGCAFNKGEILVAPFTDPGWTPLFLTAKALVMEVGGVMCHGAVVAREYGIPAVVGVKNATKGINTGDEITVDGDQGKVFLASDSCHSETII